MRLFDISNRRVASLNRERISVQSSDRPNKIPEEFNGLRDRVADRMVEMKKQHGDVMYQIVLVFDGKKNPKQLAEIKQKNCAGLKFYRDKGLEDNVKLSVYDHETLTKFDVLIIDENHVNIGFDTSEGTGSGNVVIQNAMVWRNNQVLANKFRGWFDDTILKKAESFEDWLKDQQKLAGSLAPLGCDTTSPEAK